MDILTLYLLVSSADNLCKQIGPRLGSTKHQASSGSNLSNTQMVFLKEFFDKVILKKINPGKNSQGVKSSDLTEQSKTLYNQ